MGMADVWSGCNISEKSKDGRHRVGHLINQGKTIMAIKCKDCGRCNLRVSPERCNAGMWDRADSDQEWLHGTGALQIYIHKDRFCSEFIKGNFLRVSEMRCEISEAKEHDKAFPVMFMPMPDFPDDRQIHPVVRQPKKAVTAAQWHEDNDGTGWSYTSLDGDEKHCIGDEMNRNEVPLNKWVWCTLYK